MLIDFTAGIKKITGEVIKNENKELTLRDVCASGLLADLEEEKNLSGDEKLNRYILADRIYKSTEPIELKAEEIAKIKTLVGKSHITLVVGQVYQLLEGQNGAQTG